MSRLSGSSGGSFYLRARYLRACVRARVLFVRRRERRALSPSSRGAHPSPSESKAQLTKRRRHDGLSQGERQALANGDLGLHRFRQQAELTMYCERK